METVKISKVRPNEDNPRYIKEEKFKKLVQSLKDFPEMANARPIVVNKDMVALGGNMRLKAMQEAGWKEVPVEIVDWTEEQQREFIIKDNVGFGEWDWDMIANEWDTEKLEDWGLDLPMLKELNQEGLFDIEIPFYTPSEIQPEIFELANLDKTKDLIKKIDLLKVDESLKEILKIRASFFTDFNFQKIADYFYKENKEVQDVFKDLGLVILAPKEALKRGFIELSENVFEL